VGAAGPACKHLAAVLYGVGARLDARPELLFSLRGGTKCGGGPVAFSPAQPRPKYGILVAMIVVNNTFASGGKFAMNRIMLATPARAKYLMALECVGSKAVREF